MQQSRLSQSANFSQPQAGGGVAGRSAEISQVAKTSFGGLCASFARSKGVEVILSACVIGAGAFLLVSNPFGWAAAIAAKVFFISIIVLGSLSLINAVVHSKAPESKASSRIAAERGGNEVANGKCGQKGGNTKKITAGSTLLYLKEVEKKIENKIKLAEDNIKQLRDGNASYNEEDLQRLE